MWPIPQETAALVTFTGEILNEELHFLYSEYLKGAAFIWEKQWQPLLF